MKLPRIARALQAEEQERMKLVFAAAAEPKRQEEGKAAKAAAAAEEAHQEHPPARIQKQLGWRCQVLQSMRSRHDQG